MVETIILLYHDIDSPDNPSEKEDLATFKTVVRLNEFEDQMAGLAEDGWNVLSMGRYLEKLQLGSVNSKDIVLTFDDGHYSNYKFAFPILQQYGFTATFFIIADRIETPFYMNPAALQELAAADMEIASHGLTHTFLPLLAMREIHRELEESKTVLEQVTGHTVHSFAYPGGHFDGRVLHCLQDSGYEAAASCIVGFNTVATDRFRLRRVEIRRGTSIDDFKNALTRKNILFYQGVDSVKRMVKKSVGLARYRKLRQKMYCLYPFKR